MDSSQLLNITTFVYMLSVVLYLGSFIYRSHGTASAATAVTIVALLMNTCGIGWRWLESYQLGIGRAPLTNMYESVVFFAWAMAASYLFIEFRYRTRAIGVFAMPLPFLAMVYASLTVGKEIKPLLPALQSNWLIAHVVTCFIGYAAFAVAAALGCIYLLRKFQGSPPAADGPSTSFLPALSVLDEITHKTLVFGFIWLSAGIISGAVWANSAWGTYWSWDPKETWSLITWFFYALTLHLKFTRNWSGTRLSLLSIFGLFIVLFTYYGVNFWLPGLHSYGSF